MVERISPRFPVKGSGAVHLYLRVPSPSVGADPSRVWGAFAFRAPELDAIISGTANTGMVDRRELLGAAVRALSD
jgi:hypothetical protein